MEACRIHALPQDRLKPGLQCTELWPVLPPLVDAAALSKTVPQAFGDSLAPAGSRGGGRTFLTSLQEALEMKPFFA